MRTKFPRRQCTKIREPRASLGLEAGAVRPMKKGPDCYSRGPLRMAINYPKALGPGKCLDGLNSPSI